MQVGNKHERETQDTLGGGRHVSGVLLLAGARKRRVGLSSGHRGEEVKRVQCLLLELRERESEAWRCGCEEMGTKVVFCLDGLLMEREGSERDTLTEMDLHDKANVR